MSREVLPDEFLTGVSNIHLEGGFVAIHDLRGHHRMMRVDQQDCIGRGGEQVANPCFAFEQGPL